MKIFFNSGYKFVTFILYFKARNYHLLERKIKSSTKTKFLPSFSMTKGSAKNLSLSLF